MYPEPVPRHARLRPIGRSVDTMGDKSPKRETKSPKKDIKEKRKEKQEKKQNKGSLSV